MKIQLDTTKKTIKVEEDVKLTKLIDTVKKLLPNNEWKDFTLEVNTTIQHWNAPIYVERYRDWRDYTWYCNTNVTSNLSSGHELKATGDTMALNAGVYNIEA